MFPDLTRDDVFRLETRRLWLRWPCQADVGALVRLAGDKALAEMTASIPHPYPPEAAERFVIETRGANASGDGLTVTITPRAKPNQPIGMVGIRPDAVGAPHLGYWLGLDHWGQGFATEASRALIDAFFAYAPHPDLHGAARVINPGSRRVLEKCGFAFQGSGLQAFPARGGVFPVDIFRLDGRAWESLKSWSHAGLVPQAPCDAPPRTAVAV